MREIMNTKTAIFFFATLAFGAAGCISGCSNSDPEPPAYSVPAGPVRGRPRAEVPPEPANVEAESVGPEDSKVEPAQSPHPAVELAIRFLPEAPTTDDDISVQVFGYGDIPPTYVWFRNENEILRGIKPTLKKGGFEKGDRIKVEVIAGENRGKASLTIANRPPIFTSVPPLIEKGTLYEADIQGRDPDGDKVFLLLPAPVAGVRVNEMKLIVDPAQFGSEKRTIPVGLSDGENVAGYLYTIQIKATTTPGKPEVTGSQK